MKIIVTLIALLFLTGTSHGADVSRIVMFIVERNPELTEMERLNRDILKDLKVNAYARAGYGQLTKEGTASLETEQTRYIIGLKATLPLLSKRERSERRAAAANKKLALTKEVSDLVGQYLSEQEFIAHEEEHLQRLHQELQWTDKRVTAGVDYQKDYNTQLHAYTGRQRDLAARKVVNDALLEKILSFVSEEHRSELTQLLEKPVPESRAQEERNSALHQ